MNRLTMPPKLTSNLCCLALLMTAPLASGCLEHPIKEVKYDGSIEKDAVVTVYQSRDVDVLFVIDNSGSMAEEQANLAKNFGAFVGALEAVNANYRVAVVTTDNGDPRDPKSRYEGGVFQLKSCRDRLSSDGISGGDFIFDDFNAEFACTDHCALPSEALEIVPTTIGIGDEVAAPRAWIESYSGKTNLAGGVSAAEAFACFGPQGVTGSGYEAPLEAMHRAIVGSGEAKSPNFGFLRDDAHLVVVFITDEVDCSFNPEHVDIFRTNKTFWSDPAAPTSAVCWNAGVQCSQSGEDYGSCYAVDYDAKGAAGAEAADAVLFPLDRYYDLLAEVRAAKQARNTNLQVVVSAIAGVPQGYEDGGVTIPYGASSDPNDQKLFGVAPGCSAGLDDVDPSNDSVARPPVRLRELAEAFQIGEAPGTYSICQDDYTGALRSIAEAIAEKIRPGCVTTCVEDQAPETAILDPLCVVDEVFAEVDRAPTRLDGCAVVDGAWAVPEGASACYVMRTDSMGLTPSKLDDMTVGAEFESCAEQGWNLEIEVLRASPARSGSSIRAICQQAERSACPNAPL
jgi:hypothetical protein